MITLKEGDKAPGFTGKDQDGNEIALSSYKGITVVLYFYGEAGSPTCTLESCNLRDNYSALKKKGMEVIGVSPDSIKKQKNFKSKYKLPFTLVSDPDHSIAKTYGAWDMKKLFGHEHMGVLRTTFVIDGDGIIQKIFPKPKNKTHGEEILEFMKS